MYTCLTTVMLMEHTVKNKMKQYWSKDPMISTPFFSVLFPRPISTFVNAVLCNSDDKPEGNAVFKVRNSHLHEKLKSLFTSPQGLWSVGKSS